ncbi:sushi domain-containing protein 4-like isoform X2 [Argopecten irradians]|uniref:sushi domain-containing protein 4-like isoform X2 n=1 Tax=Argopecten irradians TaxID=31199 RepID=UPI0037218467
MEERCFSGVFLCFLLIAFFVKNSWSKENNCPPLNIVNAKVHTYSLNSQEASVTCEEGYRLLGSNKLLCTDGQWQPAILPHCVAKLPSISECSNPTFTHAKVTMDHEKRSAEVHCDSDYSIKFHQQSLTTLKIVCSQDLRWVTVEGWSNIPDCTSDLECSSPPEVRHASIIERVNSWTPYTQDTPVTYRCDSGYQQLSRGSYDDYLFNPFSTIRCSGGKWVGETPVCLKIPGCSRPPDVTNAKWTIIPGINDLVMRENQNTYPIGTRVKYYCINSKIRGADEIECRTNELWSHMPPMCMNTAARLDPCSKLPMVPNGQCICNTHAADPDQCRQLGSMVECTCIDGFRLAGEDRLSCIRNSQGLNNWSASIPTCVPSDQSIQTADSDMDSGSGHMNTLAIVIATACSVLGVLLLVMVVMVFRRRKPQGRLYPQVGGTPPPYSRVYNNTIDEHDRVALIGYEAARLPSYEEATRTRSLGPSRSVREMAEECVSSAADYRPLPNIPSNLRNNSQTDTVSSRHSISTMGTVNRDGISEVFGSIDTVNVSISDASTNVTLDTMDSVTVDTLDSATSRPSNASGRATAGSLETSRENLSTEDVPLLDNRTAQEFENEDIEIHIDDSNKEIQ